MIFKWEKFYIFNRLLCVQNFYNRSLIDTFCNIFSFFFHNGFISANEIFPRIHYHFKRNTFIHFSHAMLCSSNLSFISLYLIYLHEFITAMLLKMTRARHIGKCHVKQYRSIYQLHLKKKNILNRLTSQNSIIKKLHKTQHVWRARWAALPQ